MHPTDWFHAAKWGVFHHYLADPASHSGQTAVSADDWGRRVDSFDVDALAQQLADVGAGYYFITLGQNSGHYCAPNPTYDELTGIAPGKCARRDLIADLYQALSPRGIRLMCYLPAGAPEHDAVAVARLEWQKGPHRNAEFQRKWEAVIRDWSRRWGRKVAGWWIDGCYWADAMYRHREEPNWCSFAAALKAGNPEAILAFNPGVKVPVIRHCEYDDYTAGELTNELVTTVYRRHADGWPCAAPQRFVHGAQYHVLNFLGDWWGQSRPRFPDELVVGYTRYVTRHGGVITWDVPVRPDGRIGADFLQQLHLLRGL